MRQLIINLNTENNQSKKDQVLKMLENLGVEYQTSERQSLEEYNNEISVCGLSSMYCKLVSRKSPLINSIGLICPRYLSEFSFSMD